MAKLTLPLDLLGPSNRLWVGVSGGIDSVVLLHWLRAQNLPIELAAIHVNHQLSSQADSWQKFVESLCASWRIPLQVCKVDVSAVGRGLEAAAREARYSAFAQHLRTGDAIAVAHHQEDQAETVMLRLLRGAGLKGLGGMRELRPLQLPDQSAARLWRPLLHWSKVQIRNYARDHNLQWIEDDSNADVRLQRNFLRMEVFPQLKAIWPEMANRFAQAASHLQEAEDLLAAYVDADLEKQDCRDEKLGQSIDLKAFLTLSKTAQRAVIRRWLVREQRALPEAVQLEALNEVIHAKPDAKPQLQISDYQFARYNSRLYLLPQLKKVPAEFIVQSIIPGELFLLPDKSELLITGISKAVSVRFRQFSERAHPASRARSQTLKKTPARIRRMSLVARSGTACFCGRSTGRCGRLLGGALGKIGTSRAVSDLAIFQIELDISP